MILMVTLVTVVTVCSWSLRPEHTTTKESFPSKLEIVQVFKLPFQFLLKKLIGFSILAN